MIATGVANPSELAILTEVLDDYCRDAGISASDPTREEVARHLLDLFNRGIGGRSDLMEALRSSPRYHERQIA